MNIISKHMKILILGDAKASHLINWVNSLSREANQIYLFSFTEAVRDEYDENVVIFGGGLKKEDTNSNRFNMSKLSYLKQINYIQKLIRKCKPDIVHAHYATSYGFILSFLKHPKKILSVWGSDVYNFPKKSLLHRIIFKRNLRRADVILSTSKAMKEEISLYTSKDIIVTPFGIRLDYFKPTCKDSGESSRSIVIGTIKAVDPVYGTEYLIDAFLILKEKFPNLPLKLLIVGGVNDEQYYQTLLNKVNKSNWKKDITFTGKVEYSKIVEYYNSLDVFITLSNEESFGVSVIEAQACGIPVVVTNVGGLPEVVLDNKTGFIVPPKDYISAAKAIEKLIFANKKDVISIRCRRFVEEVYDWNDSVKLMKEIYETC